MNSTYSRTIVKQFYALLLSFSLALTPVAAADAERVFAQVSPSVVVVSILIPGEEPIFNGSGVVIGEGLVVTNCHVVEDVERAVIKQPADSQGVKGYTIQADVVARDDDNDVCLLFAEDLTEPPAAPVIKLGAARDLSVGEEVYAVGTPAGLDLSLSRGIVTQLRGIGIKGKAPIVQTDATIVGGSSGGGLFNEKGELVGITTFGFEEDWDNINFAMPVEMVSELIESYRTDKERKAQAMCIQSPQYQCILRLAHQSAKQIDDFDERSSTLIDIAGAQARAGYFNDAKATAQNIPVLDDTVEEYIDEYSTDHASLLLGDVAIEQAESGYFDDAKTTAEQIDDADERAKALSEIATAQVLKGKFDDAKATSRQTGDAEYVTRILTEIAIAQAQEGSFSNAKETAKQISDVYNRAMALDNLAYKQLQAENSGDVKIIIDDALVLARQIDDFSQRADALSEIAFTQAQAGYSDDAKMTFGEASRSASQIKDAYFQASALGSIAVSQAQAGYSNDAKITFGEALRSADQVQNNHPRDEAIRDIAIAQAEVNFFDDAKETTRYIDYPYPHDEALVGIATAEAKAGNFTNAMRAAQFIDDSQLRITALANIAEAMTEQ